MVGDFITAVDGLDGIYPAGDARVVCKVVHMGMLRLRHVDPYRTMVPTERSWLEWSGQANQAVAVRRELAATRAADSWLQWQRQGQQETTHSPQLN